MKRLSARDSTGRAFGSRITMKFKLMAFTLVLSALLFQGCNKKNWATEEVRRFSTTSLIERHKELANLTQLRDKAKAIEQGQITGIERSKLVEEIVKDLGTNTYTYINVLDGDAQTKALAKAIDREFNVPKAVLSAQVSLIAQALEEQSKEEEAAKSQQGDSYERLGKATQTYLEIASMLIAMADAQNLNRDQFEVFFCVS